MIQLKYGATITLRIKLSADISPLSPFSASSASHLSFPLCHSSRVPVEEYYAVTLTRPSIPRLSRDNIGTHDVVTTRRRAVAGNYSDVISASASASVRTHGNSSSNTFSQIISFSKLTNKCLLLQKYVQSTFVFPKLKLYIEIYLFILCGIIHLAFRFHRHLHQL